MSTAASLNIRISADIGGVVKALSDVGHQAKSALGGLGGSAKSASGALDGLGRSASHAGTSLRTLVSAELIADALKSVAMSALDVGKQALVLAGGLEQSKIAFTTMLGSAEKADAFLRDLAAFAANTPFEMKGLQDASRKLLAFGFQATDIIPMMTAVGNAVSGLGGGAAEINRVTMALGQMQAKGKVSAEEMMQLAELGIPAWDMLAKKIGVSVPEAMKMAEKGAIPAAVAIEGLVNGMNQRFPDMMAKQSKTLLGAWSNLEDGIGRTLTNIGTDIVKTFNLTEVIAGVGRVTSMVADQIEGSGLRGILNSLFGPEMKAAILGIGTAITVRVIPSLIAMVPAAVSAATAMATAAAAAVAAWAPFIGLAAAVAFAATPIIRYWDDLAFEFGRVFDFIGGKVSEFVAWVQKGFQHIASAVVGPVVKWIQDKLAGLWRALPGPAREALEKIGAGFGKLGTASAAGLDLVQFAGQAAASSLKFVGANMSESFSGITGMFDSTKAVINEFTGATVANMANLSADTKLHLAGANQALSVTGKAGKKAADEIAKSFSAIQPGLEAIRTEAELFGDTTGVTAKQAEYLDKALRKLLTMGVKPTDKEFQKHIHTLKQLAEEQEKATEATGKILVPFTRQLTAIATGDKALKEIALRAQVLGPTFNKAGAEVKVLEEELLELAKSGLKAGDVLYDKVAKRLETSRQESEKFGKEVVNVDSVMKGVEETLQAVGQQAALLGDDFDLAETRAKVLKDGLKKVAEVGGEGAAEAIAALRSQLSVLEPEQDAVTAALGVFKGKATEVMAAVQGLREGLTTMGQTLGIQVNNQFADGILKAGNFALAAVQVGTSLLTLGPIITTLSGFITGTLIPSLLSAGAAFIAATGPVGWVAAAVVGLTLGTMALAEQWDELKTVFNLALIGMSPMGPALVATGEAAAWASANTETLSAAWEETGRVARKVWHEISNAAKQGVNGFVTAVNALVDGINAMGDKLGFTLPRMHHLTIETFEQAEAMREAAIAAKEQAKRIGELSQSITKGLDSSVSSAFQSTIKGFLDGTKTLEEGLREGLKSAIIGAITDAAMQGAVIKGALGGLMNQLSDTLASGGDASGIIRQISSQIPSVVRNLESQLAPLQSVLTSAFGSGKKEAEAASGGSSASKDKPRSIEEQYTRWAKFVGGPEATFAKWQDLGMPQLAAGGIATSATKAIVGEGIHPEAILPLSPPNLSYLGELIGQYARGGQQFSPAYGGAAAGDTYLTINVEVTGSARPQDARAMAEAMVRELRRLGIKL